MLTREQALQELESAKAEGRKANLTGANLYEANLNWANLRGANLYEANLRGANLRGANLRGADLRGADLREADLNWAILNWAKLRGAKLTAPPMVLLASWGKCSDTLTVELMRYDAWNHPDPYAFDVWGKTGACPYQDCHVQRAANFTEKKELWPGWNPRKKVLSAYQLMNMLLEEHCITGEEEKC